MPTHNTCRFPRYPCQNIFLHRPAPSLLRRSSRPTTRYILAPTNMPKSSNLHLIRNRQAIAGKRRSPLSSVLYPRQVLHLMHLVPLNTSWSSQSYWTHCRCRLQRPCLQRGPSSSRTAYGRLSIHFRCLVLTLSSPCTASSSNTPERMFRILLTSDFRASRHPLLPTPRRPCNRLTRGWT